MSNNLQMAVNGEYFDQMEAGTKRFEYRLRNDYWRKRLEGRQYDTLTITKGYPSSTDQERILKLTYLGYEEQTITHPHFGNEPVDVYAIRVDINTRH